MNVKFIDLGVKEYKETWDYQQAINSSLSALKTGEADSNAMQHLLFVEHPHVYTLGKSGKENNLLINGNFLKSIGASFFKTDRGGDITYHGPGQIVGYPIIDLNALGIGVKQYVKTLENVIIATLKDYNIDGILMEGATGVWIENVMAGKPGKICAIGVKVSRGITMHGFALNVNSDLRYFSYINPCGFTDRTVTSMELLLGHKLNMEEVKYKLKKYFADYFKVEINS